MKEQRIQPESSQNGASILDPQQANGVDKVNNIEMNNNNQVLRKFDSTSQKTSQGKLLYVVVGVIVVLAGVGTGYVFSGKSSAKNDSASMDVVKDANGEVTEAGEIVSEDLQEAEGTLVEGGIDGEGTHTLERGMGPEKDVTLFSTSIVLDGFVGKKVKVWGETVSSQKAGWLMDVSKIKVIN